jgi:hypothetical protein
MGGQVVKHHMHGPAAGHGVDLFEEPQHVGAAVALVQVGDHLAGGDVHRGEQVDGAVAFVVVGHRGGPAAFHRQRRLGAVQGRAPLGRGRGAWLPFGQLVSPSPPAEPDVRVPTHPALHKTRRAS